MPTTTTATPVYDYSNHLAPRATHARFVGTVTTTPAPKFRSAAMANLIGTLRVTIGSK